MKKFEFIDDELDAKEYAKEIRDDYTARKLKKQDLERTWLLNMNFLAGNQYSYISSNGDIESMPKRSATECREVFNHIAPIVESRLAKLSRVRPSMGVRPTSSSENDVETAKISRSILDSVTNSLNLSDIVSEATLWSEVCGTSFYKIVWDENLGNIVGYDKSLGKGTGEVLVHYQDGVAVVDDVGADKSECGQKNGVAVDGNGKLGLGDGTEIEETSKIMNEASGEASASGGVLSAVPIYDGDIRISVCSPFEIFPENSCEYEVSLQPSIICARAVDAKTVEKLYGIKVCGEPINAIRLENFSGQMGLYGSGGSSGKVIGEQVDDMVIVIERWTKPCEEFKNGRLSIVAGDTLVFDGEMPYSVYPFVKQVSNRTIGSFWGTSIIERCIPVQRAYNAIKNRKLEALNRLCGGVLAVEEGSVDVEELIEEGLSAGKVVVYRNGSTAPRFMDSGSVPSELTIEEERLTNELISLSGVSELMRNSALPSQVNSGTAINLLIEQDDTRLSVTAENIRNSMLEISKRVLKLYKQFAKVPKLAKIVDEYGKLQLFYWNGSDITSDDVVLETSNELTESLSSRKNMVFELLKYGLLVGENGRLDERTKAKVIEMLGFGNWESGADEVTLQMARAKSENISNDNIMVLEIDDHALHIREHTKYILERNEINGEKTEKLISHIRQHKMFAE